MTARSANTDDGACSDIRARGFWNVSQDAFFDVRCSTQTHPPTVQQISKFPPSTRDMNKPRNGNMDNESEKLNVACSPLLFSLQLVAWDGRQQLSSNALQT